MKKTGIIFGLVLLASFGWSQEKFTVVLSGQVFNAEGDKISLLQQNVEKQNITVAEIPIDEKGNFEKAIALSDKDYYTFSLEDGQGINLILNKEDTVSVYGDGRNLFYNSNIINSEESSALLDFLRVRRDYEIQLDSVEKYLRENPSKRQEIQQGFSMTHQIFMGERQRFMAANGNSPALLGALSTINVEQEFSVYERLVKQLAMSFKESPTVERIVTEYESNKKIMEARMPLAPGAEAKEISLPNPEGEILNLSDYRGKVVLIDFWASWCGPCRRENPNVVRLYNKYRDKGFDVFSVSLDKTKESWVQAIEKDELAWPGHVSDLMFWRSEAAKAYNVSAIPFTVLIDKEGKVIGTNLKGERLAATLAEIFGE